MRHKPGKVARYNKFNVPKKRKYGSNVKRCKRCLKAGAHVSKYGIHLCRQCFREVATKIGFKKFS
ncbi:MAG: 30S ribosomal protein S14 [Candidatus Woesearchaeota archaeon]